MDMYVANSRGSSVSVINTASNTVVANVSVGGNPSDVLFDPLNGEVYVSNGGGNGITAGANTLSVIQPSTNLVIRTINVGAVPSGITLDSATGNLFVANGGSGNFTVVSGTTNSVIANAGTWALDGPLNSAYDPGNGIVYFADRNGVPASNLTYVNATTFKVLGNIPIGQGGTGVAYDPANAMIVSMSTINSTLNIIDPKTERSIQSVPIRCCGGGQLTYDPLTGEVLLANEQADEVQVVGGSTNRIVANISTGALSGPDGIAVDSANGELYVSDFYLNSVVVLTLPSASYAVTFTQGGLPTGTNWSIGVNGTRQYSTTTTISFTEPNGSYSYAVGLVGGYSASPAFGTVSVIGANRAILVSFSPLTYSVTFTETGLTGGTNWSVTFHGATEFGKGGIIFPGFTEGTYPFTVGSVTGYASMPSSGEVNVSGANVTKAIAFRTVAAGGSPQAATFLGLPAVEGYGLVGGVAAAIVAGGAGAMVYWKRRRMILPESGETHP